MSKRLALAIAVAVLNAIAFAALAYYIQGVADSGAAAAPWWFGFTWTVISFPGRFAYLLPALNHPFGFGEHEDLILYCIAGANGIVWGGLVWLAGSLRRKRAA